MKTRLLLILGIIAMPLALLSATFTVTNTLDAGAGSLREAITQANSNGEADTIEFAIPQADVNYNSTKNVWTIRLSSALPVISAPGLKIDGFTQLGSYQLSIEISGENILGAADGFSITSQGNIIQGLSIGGFHGNAIRISGSSAQNNQVFGCLLGLKLPGTKNDGYKNPADAAISYVDSRGLYIGQLAGANSIGGEAIWQRNIISHNYYEGILLDTAQSNFIVNNYIGTAANGTDAMGNGWISVQRYRPDEMLVDRCPAIRVKNSSFDNTIGGSSTNAANIICGSGHAGIILEGEQTENNMIIGNKIGLAADGLSHTYCGNSYNGILVQSMASSNQIGGQLAGEGNYISGNASHGIMFLGSAIANIVSGNFIGLDGSGASPVPNEKNGIHLKGTSNLLAPQTTSIGPGNKIFYNYGYGIYIEGSGAVRNTITSNLISSNVTGAINLVSGGNQELNAPSISSNLNQVTGTTVANGKVEFFSADGTQYLGSKQAEATGDFTWNSGSYTSGIMATVTDAYGNTSEFSATVSLPVEFAAFTAAFDKGYVNLNWSTESESNNFGFYVERKLESWESIGFVQGTGTTNEKSNYSFVDEDPQGETSTYRLRQVDFDGAVSYSNVVEVNNVMPQQFYLDNPYPNPFNMEVSIVVGIAKESNVEVEIFNTLGQRVRVLASENMSVGEHRLHWNGFSDSGAIVPSGLYFIRMQSPGFAKTKQILLIK